MKKIIYIEDNYDTAEAVKMLLDRAGFKIEIAYTGKEAIERILDNHFDLTIIDIMLPDMSGWDIFETLRKKQTKAKFVFLSAIPISSTKWCWSTFKSPFAFISKSKPPNLVNNSSMRLRKFIDVSIL